jgi:TetR/AcrR family transcriptional regulator, mexJK operon transcriptional repressor
VDQGLSDRRLAEAPRHPSATGRPPSSAGSAKQDSIIEAAAEVFLEQGFGSASMDEIARRAGVSKATVYSHFDSKPALFGAIVQHRCQRTMSAMLAEMSDKPAAETLTAVGRQFLDVLMMPGSLPLYRVVLAEAPRFPELGRIFYEAGPDRCAIALAQYLADLHERGILNAPDARWAAEQFLGAVLGQIHVRMLLMVAGDPPSPDERTRYVAAAVSTFLEGRRRD